VHTFASSGTYNVKLVITSTGGGTDELIQNVVVKPKPNNGVYSPIVCRAIATTFTNTTDQNGLNIPTWYWILVTGQSYNDINPPHIGYLGPQIILLSSEPRQIMDALMKQQRQLLLPAYL